MEFQTETASLEHGTSSRNETAYLVCKRAFDIAASFCALVVPESCVFNNLFNHIFG